MKVPLAVVTPRLCALLRLHAQAFFEGSTVINCYFWDEYSLIFGHDQEVLGSFARGGEI